jgi:hypothetical protein
MATVKVKPLPDGTSLRGNWQVTKSGARQSKHRKKSAAERKAYRVADSGDDLWIIRADGTVQDKRTVR